MDNCKCTPVKSLAEQVIEYREFFSLVKRMRDAQWAFDMITGEEDIAYIDMLQIVRRETEREVDEYLNKMEE